MRRSEFLYTDPAEITAFLDTCQVGHLGIITPDNYPRVVPVNYVAIDQTIYFHSAAAGEKFEILKTNPRVSFSVSRQYAYIPSYWFSKENATMATSFYKSVLITGSARMLTDLNKKANALQKMMEKYQPEGNFQPVNPTDPIYRDVLKQVAIFRIDSVSLSMKSKFGQNLSKNIRRQIIDKLLERNDRDDHTTVEEIRKALPL